MEGRRWPILLAGLVAVSAAIGFLVEPWSGLTTWFGDEPKDKAWAHVAVGVLVFASLLVLCQLTATGVPRVLKAFGVEVGSQPALASEAIAEVQMTLRMSLDHVRLLTDHLRQVRESGEADRAAIHRQLEAMTLQINEVSRQLADLHARDTARLSGTKSSPDAFDENVRPDQ